MQVPELYHYGREGSWFGIRLFFIYMFDGVVQVSILSHLNQRLTDELLSLLSLL